MLVVCPLLYRPSFTFFNHTQKKLKPSFWPEKMHRPPPESPLLDHITTIKDVGYLEIDESFVLRIERQAGRKIVLRVKLQARVGANDQDKLLEWILRWNFAQAAQLVESIYLDATAQDLYAEWAFPEQQLYQTSMPWRLEGFLNRCEFLCNLLSHFPTAN
jgi:Tir chaperone protein (CesT) family